jgi:hypothetical protein
MWPSPCTGFISPSLQLVPVDDQRRLTIRLGVEIGFRRVGQTETATVNVVYVFTRGIGNKSVEFGLYHLRLLRENEKTPPHAGQRENHTASV